MGRIQKWNDRQPELAYWRIVSVFSYFLVRECNVTQPHFPGKMKRFYNYIVTVSLDQNNLINLQETEDILDFWPQIS